MANRTRYSEEFKQEAVRQAPKLPFSEDAKQLIEKLKSIFGDEIICTINQ